MAVRVTVHMEVTNPFVMAAMGKPTAKGDDARRRMLATVRVKARTKVRTKREVLRNRFIPYVAKFICRSLRFWSSMALHKTSHFSVVDWRVFQRPSLVLH